MTKKTLHRFLAFSVSLALIVGMMAVAPSSSGALDAAIAADAAAASEIDDVDWKLIYKEKIKEIISEHKQGKWRDAPISMFLVDIDRDGIPELIVQIGHYTAFIDSIYTAEGGAAVKLNLDNTLNGQLSSDGKGWFILSYYYVYVDKRTNGSMLFIQTSDAPLYSEPVVGYVTGELVKAGLSVEFKPRFKITENEAASAPNEYSYFDARTSSYVSARKEEFDRRVTEYFEPLDRDRAASGKYALDEALGLLGSGPQGKREEYISSFRLSGVEPVEIGQIDVFLDGFEADGHIKVYLNGERIVFDQQPFVENGRTLVPVRAVAEAMGAEVSWDNSTKTAEISYGGSVLRLTQDSDVAIVIDGDDGLAGQAMQAAQTAQAAQTWRAVALDAPLRLVNGRCCVPLRFISESFGADVDWSGSTNTVSITKPML